MQNIDIIDLCILEKLCNNEYELKKVKNDKKLELKDFKIPNYITNINANAFKGCSNLKNLEISKSVKNIDEDAFYGCENLDNVYYDGTIEDWCNITFYDDDSNPMFYANHFYIKNNNNEYEEVTEIVIPNIVTKIGNYQFCGFSNVTNIKIQDGVKCIDEFAFAFCTSLKNIGISSTITFIDTLALYECTSLTSINVDSNNKNYVSINGDLYSNRHNEKILIQYAIGKSDTLFEIPSNVTYIGNSAFAGCTNLKIIEIPNSVTSISYYAFAGCINLKSIEIPNSVTSIECYAFKGCTSLTSIEIPSSVTRIGKYVFGNYSGVTSVASDVFGNCINLTNINVDSNNKYFTSIEGNLYSHDKKSLIQYAIGKPDTSFYIPNSVTSICNNAFESCTSLINIEIPSSVASIGYYLFSSGYDLTIYCEAKSKPKTWEDNWNSGNYKVIWNYTKNKSSTY